MDLRCKLIEVPAKQSKAKHTMTLFASRSSSKLKVILDIGVFTIGPLRPCPPPPPLNCEKISRTAKNATKMRHFQAKNLKNFLGRRHSPSPDPTPTGEGNTPDQTLRHSPSAHLTLSAAALDPLHFFPISIITLDSDAVIDEFGKSNRRLVLLVDLGLLNGTRLEVGPVNIQSSH